MKKIVFVLPPFLPVPATKGGAVETLLELFIKENEKKPQFEIIVFSVYEKKSKEISEQYKYTKIISIKWTFLMHFLYSVKSRVLRKCNINLEFFNLFSKKVIKSIRKMKKNKEIDLCIVEGEDYREYRRLAKILGKEKLSIHIHGAAKPKGNPESIYGSFIYVSEAVKKIWDNENSFNNYVLRNAVDEERFLIETTQEEHLKVRESLNLKKDDFVVLYCGRLSEEKGVLELLKAISKIDNEKIKLVIVGSSNFEGAKVTPYQRQLQAYISDKVIFTGYVDNNYIYKYHKIANVFASPSICEEGAGLMNIEASLSGKAIITTNMGGIPEYILKENAVLLDFDGNREVLVEEIKQAVLFLYNNPDKVFEMEEKTKEYSSCFTKKVYFESYVKIINDIIDRSRGM